ncbi:MAG TPA: helicase-related protein [Candidatus Competibacter sp.]|nr:DEAD/DEAH box helicase family protein [Candidatus Competibacteraceae bacterium]HPE70572.1 helicase-related protein [Candidatus Competibacter sp.]HRX70599.1 helicase-related protein [Candidatus Competibacteraceae bacterium]
MSPTNNSGLRDNYTRGTVADFLKGKIQDGSRLSVVSAYFTIYAYDALKDYLDRIDHLDFLFGEPSYVNRLDPSKTEKKAFIIDSDGLALSNRLQQKRVAKECAEWIEQKVDIKTIKQSNLLHGKMYHVATSGVEDAILGSSNFTVRGLGLGEGGNNIELNLIVDSNRDRQELKQWFKEVWGDEKLVKDVKEDVLLDLRKLYANQPPQLIYYLTLFHLFRDYLDGTRDVDDNIRRVALPETRIWRTLFTFQKDGAKAAINKILDYNGCILADSVGLGKTYTALAVIKYFEQRNERVLVLCPKKLSRNWTIYRNPSSLNPFSDDKFRYDVLHHTDLSRESGNVNGLELDTLNWGAYDLVVIDESHNFRNNKLATQRPGDKEERRSRYQRLMEDIISMGVKTKVLLLSATPVNNQLADLRNQISFIAGGDVARNDVADGAFSEKLNILSVRDTSRQAQTQFTNWAKKPPGQRKTRELIAAIGGDFFKLLDGLSIARSRSQIAAYYAGEMKELGGFPRRPAPKAIHAAIDLERRFLSFEQLDTEISALRLALYHPTSFLRDDIPVEVRAAYENKILGGFTQEGRERILIAMMKVNFLKRLESSVDSFRLTLERTIAKIDQLEARITAFEKHLDDNPDLDYDSLTPDQLEDPDFDEEDFTIGGRRRIHLAHLKLPEWLKAVRNDRTQLQFLLEKTRSVTPKRDGKLTELKAFIEAKVRQPTTNRDGKANRKVLVFTAFADTARYLHEHLDPWARKELKIHTGLVCGDGGNAASLGRTDYDDILTNFSPIAKRRADQAPRFSNQREEIDLLIATDCISEGQNLQDCDQLINYDIHWNPVRIIQRFGRIDRIGSRNDSVQLVNFWPVADLDHYLGLKLRVEARMALADLAATQTDNLLDPGQLEDLIKEDLLFRDRQLKRLKDEILDLEDLDDSVSLTDFSLDEFRMDLLRYLEANRAELEGAGEGIYAVVPPKSDLFIAAQPGAIFCLRHRTLSRKPSDPSRKSGDSTKLNPLAPYYLVYVHDDGTVRFSFAQPKETMLLLRDLAAGEPAAFEKLCDLFDQRTQDGADMSHYDGLLRKALASIEHTFQRRAAASLLSGRAALLPNTGDVPTSSGDDFDLVTWLVLMETQ